MSTGVVVLDGEVVRGGALPVSDPAVRWGEGLFETMRAQDGRVPLLDRHVRRLERSAKALGLDGTPRPADVAACVARAVALCGAPVQRVRVTVSTRPTLLVEALPHPPRHPRAAAGLRLATQRGAWCPSREIARHKTLSYGGYRLAERRARAAGADHALLLDHDGRLGEAGTANVLVVAGGRLVTPPDEGLLPGIARAVVIDGAPDALGTAVEVRHVDEGEWARATEIVLTNALEGPLAAVSVDHRTVGSGVPGPVARLLRAFWDDVMGAEGP